MLDAYSPSHGIIIATRHTARLDLCPMSNTDTIPTDKVGTVGEDTNPNLLITLRSMTFTQSPLLLIVGTTLDTALLDRITSVSHT